MMKLPWPLITDPVTNALNVPAVQENLDALARASTGTGGQALEIRGGTGTLTFTASSDAATASVNHGLGRMPASIVTTAFNAPTPGNRPVVFTGAWTATSFAVGGETKTTFSGSIPFSWIAIG